jgi:hypothetical protein
MTDRTLENSPPSWRVLIGEKATEAEAGVLAKELRRELGAAFVVYLDEPGSSSPQSTAAQLGPAYSGASSSLAVALPPPGIAR